ncbi:Co2+/Mg2+ efflux protein ApaG [Pseudemcibacter aquimaris]|uniref:Co2+/Mg2+ efflux protein ApaG n=1 Tax=Pseudemcibacter aquimaris TaxID=2857064 RepID=UPI00201209EC|nr:Co2+/Mg2+ efflux protein ApaG [Pseudemcibacter aquimaris]MCC3862408.1 Co2+/Mg2+ efflux protein ApaG [Pseudemcibacter aquimaris]WDU59162.1 Co2+/Mg2+ efflux protein ApaG [Pseudemcibacter aquimaris]
MDDKKTYKSITNDIGVSVEPFYLDQESEPDEGRYVWGYQVQIENHGPDTVQLRRRHWIITDGNGMTQEVEGEGVVGEQPVLEPGEAYEYTSGAPLRTPSGFMVGSYKMQAGDGTYFDVEIPAFSLDMPTSSRRLH